MAPQPAARPQRSSEDCLHLNVWTPALGDGGKRPVMVWFHPGAFSSGTSNELEADGARLSRARRRRGRHRQPPAERVRPSLPARSSAATSSPTRATSACSTSCSRCSGCATTSARSAATRATSRSSGNRAAARRCATLMAMPAARGLFHRVITMSGQQITGSRTSTADAARASSCCDALQLPATACASSQTLPMEQLVDGQPRAGVPGTGQGRPLAAARSVRSRCAAALGRHPDDPRQHARRDAHADRPRRSVDLRSDLGDAAAEARGQLAVHGHARSRRGHRRRIGAGIRTYSPADVFFAATTASRSWRGQVIEADRRAAQPVGVGAHLGVPVRLGDADRRRQVGRASRPRRAVRLRQRRARAGEGRHRRRRARGSPRCMSDVVDCLRAHGQSQHARPAALAGLRPRPAAPRWCSTRRRESSTIRAATNAGCSRRCRMSSRARSVLDRLLRSSAQHRRHSGARRARRRSPIARAARSTTMKRATTFMVDTVSTNGGYVWTYLPDLSRRWGEMEARADDDLDPAAGHGVDGPSVPRRLPRHRRRVLTTRRRRKWPAR